MEIMCFRIEESVVCASQWVGGRVTPLPGSDSRHPPPSPAEALRGLVRCPNYNEYPELCNIHLLIARELLQLPGFSRTTSILSSFPSHAVKLLLHIYKQFQLDCK